MNKLVIAAATGLIAIGGVVGVAGSANAATPTTPQHTLAEVQKASATRTTKLVEHINKLDARVSANTKLTVAQKSGITAALAADAQNVEAGAAKVAADTTVKQAHKDSRETLRKGRAIVLKEAKAFHADIRADKAAKK